MSKIVGLDLGTTNSLVATVDSGIPYVIADADGHRLCPSVVHFPAADAAPVVGHAANRVRVLHPASTVYSVKRFMGRRGADIAREEMLVTYPVRGEGAGPVTIPIHGRDFSPEEISAEVLKKLKHAAEADLGEAVTRAVITVPAYFNDAQRNATKRAGELAGFTVERIVNEPTAAALAYGLDRLKEHSKIAVYDLGGGTFDLSILELNAGVFQVLATNGNTRLGGDDLDKRLVDFLAERIKATGGPDLTNSQLSTLNTSPSSPACAKPPRPPKSASPPRPKSRSRSPSSRPISASATSSRARSWNASPATSSSALANIASALSATRSSKQNSSTKSSSSAGRRACRSCAASSVSGSDARSSRRNAAASASATASTSALARC